MNNKNNFNSQNNSMNNSNPMQPVKNRFFNQNLFNDDLDDVGSSLSNQVTNWGVQNESSMVASADFKNMLGPEQPVAPVPTEQLSEEPKTNQFASIFSQDLLEDVNATLYSASQPEVLDDSIGSNVNSFNNINNMPISNNNVNNNNNNNNNNNVAPANLFGYTENEVLDTPVVEALSESVDILETNDIYNNSNSATNVPSLSDNSLVGAAAPIFNQNIGMENVNNQEVMANDLMAQQPLSMTSLGATPIGQNEVPDVMEDSKYFPSPDPIIQKEKEQMEQNNKPPIDLMKPSVFEEDVIVIDETALLKAYVGKKYDKYFKSNFDAFTLFFGSLAFFVRGMYFIGILLFVFQMFVAYTFKDIPFIILAVFVVLGLIMALIINPLYLSLSKKKVASIRKKHPKVSQGDLNNICAKRGTNNVVLALIFQIILLVGAGFLAIKLLGVDYFKDLYNSLISTFEEKPKQSKFNGELEYNDLNIENYFVVDVPSDYRKEDDGVFSYSYVTEGVGENNSCSFKFGGIDGYDNSKELLVEIAKHYEVSENIASVKYNELEWNLLYIEKDNGKVYYRATDIDNNVILFEFESGADTPSGVCDSQIVIILDSIVKK